MINFSITTVIALCYLQTCTSFYSKLTHRPSQHTRPWARSQRDRLSELSMTLYPIPNSLFSKLSPRQVTMAQWYAYWGTNKVQRLQKILESVLLAYGGMWFSWFISFMAGPLVSSVVGTAMIFNWMYTPWLNSYNTNKSQWIFQDRKLKHAVFSGRIVRLRKIRRKTGKTIGGIAQDYLDLLVEDDNGRALEIVTPWHVSYKLIREEMSLETVVASPSKDFKKIVAVTDSYLPSIDSWIGDYPHLNKDLFVTQVSKSLPKGSSAADPFKPAPYPNDYTYQPRSDRGESVR